MAAKSVFRGLIVVLKKAVLAALVLVLLFSSLPAGQAQAASNINFGNAVKCFEGFYRYSFYASGDYLNQPIAFRIIEFRLDSRLNPIAAKYLYGSGFAYTNAKVTNISVPDILSSAQITVPKGTIVKIMTEAWFWNNSSNKWEGPFYSIALHTNSVTYANGDGSYCIIY